MIRLPDVLRQRRRKSVIQPLATTEGRLAWRQAVKAHNERQAAEIDRLVAGPIAVGDDPAPSAERAGCLAAWCAGFLAGLAHHPVIFALAECREILPDLTAIAQAACAEGNDEGEAGEDEAGEDEAGEEEEVALMELIEYVRGAVMLLRQSARWRPASTGARA